MMMQNMEDYQEDASGIQVLAQTSSLKYGLWINTTKNPRLKTVEFSQLGISLEVTSPTVGWLYPALHFWTLLHCCSGKLPKIVYLLMTQK